ncbi:hypothetical protein BB559_005051 [Furculomyces boomerangus]|uniref:Uncharacterized protein n=2 Tax=Harpellales TaxID=61421 RepID=A0A2T9YB51_9FUNG|nr:hypothetical protein BB559_005051 [Furculomyces boomerangus]PWA00021.1 hypothetical protein BB558_003891 [Smittium angustum]PWA02471.1 hypothetical protein BB558_001365 [Smittium angustum]
MSKSFGAFFESILGNPEKDDTTPSTINTTLGEFNYLEKINEETSKRTTSPPQISKTHSRSTTRSHSHDLDDSTIWSIHSEASEGSATPENSSVSKITVFDMTTKTNNGTRTTSIDQEEISSGVIEEKGVFSGIENRKDRITSIDSQKTVIHIDTSKQKDQKYISGHRQTRSSVHFEPYVRDQLEVFGNNHGVYGLKKRNASTGNTKSVLGGHILESDNIIYSANIGSSSYYIVGNKNLPQNLVADLVDTYENKVNKINILRDSSIKLEKEFIESAAIKNEAGGICAPEKIINKHETLREALSNTRYSLAEETKNLQFLRKCYNLSIIEDIPRRKST